MQDIHLPLGSVVEVMTNGKVIWVNGEEGCIVRIQGLRDVIVNDLREIEDKEREPTIHCQCGVSFFTESGFATHQERVLCHNRVRK